VVADRGRWYLAASWRLPASPTATVQQAVAGGVLAVDLNAGHLACWQIDADGNPVGTGIDIPLVLDGLAASTRDGRLRAAISLLLEVAGQRGCTAIGIEDLDFADARASGRETMGRGQHWQRPLQARYPQRQITRHHAACVVLGRRALGLRARRRPGVPAPHRRMEAAERPSAGAASYRPGRVGDRVRAGHDPPATRPGSPTLLEHKTGSGDRTRVDAQVAQNRPVPPVSTDQR
jgi:hypothetical protein